MSSHHRNERPQGKKRFPPPGRSTLLSAGLVLLLVLLPFPRNDAAAGEHRARTFDVAVGAGANVINDLSTRQLLIVPAVTWPVPGISPLWFRLEGHLEAIYYEGTTTFVAGAAPLLRLFPFSGEGRHDLFLEGGAGINIISRSRVADRDLGNSLLFSPMGGLGYVIPAAGHSLSVSLRYRHMSNAGLRPENDGIDSLYLLVALSF